MEGKQVGIFGNGARQLTAGTVCYPAIDPLETSDDDIHKLCMEIKQLSEAVKALPGQGYIETINTRLDRLEDTNVTFQEQIDKLIGKENRKPGGRPTRCTGCGTSSYSLSTHSGTPGSWLCAGCSNILCNINETSNIF